MNPCIAIIDHNTLSSIALQGMLWDIFPNVEIISFNSIESFFSDCNRYFVHYFVSSEILLKHSGEFDLLKKETIVTSLGPASNIELAGYKVIDISLPEKSLVASILQLHNSRHNTMPVDNSIIGNEDSSKKLSQREEEVLALMVKGYFNKEIAEKLNISTPTVIFHRNNICSKLGTRSIGKLTIQAVLTGLVSINEL